MQQAVQPAPSYDDIMRLFYETSLKFQETEKIVKGISITQEQTEREIKSLSSEIKSVSKSIGRLSNRLGEFVEEAVRPAAVRLFQERGIDVHEVHQNIVVKRDG